MANKTIKEAQQELAMNCGFRNEIIWDLLPSTEALVVKKKIEQLIPDQKTNTELRDAIFKSVWNQRKYTNGTSISYIFYVMVTKNLKSHGAQNAFYSKEYSCHPVFRCKKCSNNSDTRNCCMIYVDETGRVYQNWSSFVKENVLPAGIMVTPRRGVYNFGNNDQVILDAYFTPNGTPEAEVMAMAQSGAAAIGLGAACVPLAGLVFPVAAPIMAAAGVIGLGIGAFTTINSVLNLSDRKKHEQSISVTDREARSSYLGILGGTAGLASTGATRVMSSMASAGKSTAGIKVLVNGINITSIALSGSGVANNVLDLIFKYNDGDKISSMDILQLSSSLVLFTHSLYNFRLASQIANNGRNNSIKSYRKTLMKLQRNMFHRMSKETVRIMGNTRGKMDIVRGVNTIPDRKCLNDLFKVNKKLNKQNVPPSFSGGSGKNTILKVPVNSAELSQRLQHQQDPNLLEPVTRPIPSTYNGDANTRQTSKEATQFYANGNVVHDEINGIYDSTIESLVLPSGAQYFLNAFGKLFINNISDSLKFNDVILCMFDNLAESSATFLIKLAQNFVENKKEVIEQVIKIFIPTESVLYRILKYVLENYSDLCYQFISQKGDEIKSAVKKYYLALNPNSKVGLKFCPDCRGKIAVCEL